MKKESIILIVVIVVLAGFLVFQDTRRTGVQLPHLTPVAGKDLTKIEITHGGKTLTLKRKDDDWFIGKENWPADATAVKQMSAALSHLRLTALVAESKKSYGRYDLTPDKKTTVSAWVGNKEVRHFDIGKVAETYEHTFVKLSGDPNVYHAMGNFKRTFARSAEALRDKQVLSVTADAIHQIDIAGKGMPFTLKRETKPVKKPAPVAKKKKAAPAAASPAVPPKRVWKDGAGQTVDPDAVKRFLSEFSQLRCSAYLTGKKKTDLTDPIRTITLTGDKPYTLSLFKKTKQGYPAVSSENAYPFVLQDYTAQDILKQIDALSPKGGLTKGDGAATSPKP